VSARIGPTRLWPALAALFGCGRLHFDPAGDAALGAWSTPTPVPGADTALNEEDCTMSSTTLELYFAVTEESATVEGLYVMTRATAADSWSSPLPLGLDPGADEDASPRLTPDDLTLYYASVHATGLGGLDIYTVARAAVGATWSAPQAVPQVETTQDDRWMSVCDDGHFAMVSTVAGEELFEGVLGGGAPTAIAELDTTGYESSAYLTPDCLTLYFAANRNGQRDLFVTERASVSDPWQTPSPLDQFNDPVAGDEDPWMSPDGRTFVFASDRAMPGSGKHDVYMSTR